MLQQKDDVAASHKGIIPGNSLNVTHKKSLCIHLFRKVPKGLPRRASETGSLLRKAEASTPPLSFLRRQESSVNLLDPVFQRDGTAELMEYGQKLIEESNK